MVSSWAFQHEWLLSECSLGSRTFLHIMVIKCKDYWTEHHGAKDGNLHTVGFLSLSNTRWKITGLLGHMVHMGLYFILRCRMDPCLPSMGIMGNCVGFG